MKQFDNIRAHKPEGIENRKAYIVGGGVAGLATTVFLIDDCYVPGENVTIYDQLPLMGGSMDGAKIGDGKYTCRGERELEPYMECFWYLGNKIPSLYTPGRTITEETVDVNKADRIYAHSRILHQQGKVWEGIKDYHMSQALSKKLMEMIAMPEEQLDGLTIEEYFGNTYPEFEKHPIWQCFHTMLAFKEYHSMIEMKRYMVRFIQFQPHMDTLDGILHTKYNEFDSYIAPILHWLRDKGVHFLNGVTVTDLKMNSDFSVVTEIVGTGADGDFTGAMSIMDSAWDISFVLYDKYYPNQAEDEDILWFDGLYGERIGDYVKKPMADCTGEEVMQKFLYHLGLLDEYDELMKHTYVSLTMMPYITSQSMPRNSKGDRPHVIPEGSKNYAFVGQYVELDGDVVFTVETSVRTAMMAAYGLTGIDRKVLPLYQGQYDIRWLVMCMKKMLMTREIKFSDLLPINPLTVKKDIQGALDFLNSVPDINWDDGQLY